MRVKVEKKGGSPDLQKLLIPTEFHPRGRVQIDPLTGLVKNPKNNVLGYKEKIVRHESGIEIARFKVPINGGHVLKEGSVWRIALGGPARYHKKVLDDDARFRNQGKTDRTAPQLEYVESVEYAKFLKFLEEKGKVDEVRESFEGKSEDAETKRAYASLNEEFYAWMGKAKPEVHVHDGEVAVSTNEKKPTSRTST